jgi:hypothetical protein
MTPFEFGQFVKLAAGNGSSFWSQWANPPKPAGTPTNSPYLNTLDRWYNPWSKQQVTERGETGLMRAGQAAMGVGAATGAAAGGIAAAPALASAGNSALAGASALGASASTQAPKITNTINNAAYQISSRAPSAQSLQSMDAWGNTTINNYDKTKATFGMR